MIDINTLSPEERRRVLKLLRQRDKLISQNWLATFQPYPKQLDFFETGSHAGIRERLLIAANQVGKTWCAGAEVAYHATGLYPKDWRGRRWDRPTIGWASGVTTLSTRDNPQRVLLGRVGAWGTGAIPLSHLSPLEKHISRSHGIADGVDHIKVEHVSGGQSLVYFKSYEQGREKWQGESIDYVWFDEEPPHDIYSEGLTRTNAMKGMIMLTFTPLLGMSTVVKKFLLDKSPGTEYVSMTLEDAEHYTDDEREKIRLSYKEHEREARTLGLPALGSGRIFPVEENALREGTVAIPHWWPRLAAIDFGWDHPTAVVWGAWDRDADVVHVYDAYRVREKTPLLHAAAIKTRGPWIPCAWPHDGANKTSGADGISLAQQYKTHGVNMLKKRATYKDGTTSVEAGLMDMLDRMHTGRLKVAQHLSDWWEEFRLYHRKDGKVVSEGDDLMSATRYLIMMLREAEIAPSFTREPVIEGYGVLDETTGF